MLKIILYLLFCLCLFLMVYFGFFKKDRIEIRLEEIGKDPLDTPDMDVNAQKQDKNNTLRFIRIPQSVRDDIAASGIMLRTEEFVMLWIALVLFPAILLYMFGAGALLSICVAFVMGLLPPLYVKTKRKKRLELFGVQLGEALPLMSNGLRAGFSFEQAFASVAKDMPDPISQEITKSCRELSMGVPLDTVLNSLTEELYRWTLPFITGTGDATLEINPENPQPKPNVGPQFSGVALGEDGEPYCVDKSMNMTGADVKKTLLGLMPLIQERLKFLTEAAEMVHFMFTEPAVPPADQIIPKRIDAEKTKEVLEVAKEFVAKVFETDHEGAENFAKAKAEELGIKLGDFMMPIRMAVTGSRVSPPLIGSISVLGKERSLQRIERTLATL